MKKNIFLLGLIVSLGLQPLNAQESQYESKGIEWIQQNSKNLKSPDFTNYELAFVYKGKSGETLRYQQFLNDVPILNSEIIIHFNKKGEISQTTENITANLQRINTTPSLSETSAVQKIVSFNKSQSTNEAEILEKELVVFLTETGETKLVYRIITHTDGIKGHWEHIVDAQNGTTLSSKDIASYYCDHEEKQKKKKETASGEAYIFDPDPLTATGSVYGGNYIDNNDQTTPELDAARKLVTLDEIEFSEDLYHLKNSRVQIAELETPTKGLFSQATNQFFFDRSQDGFEAVNAFYHLNASLKYINEDLELVVKPLTNNGILLFDPHAVDGDDNSYYSGDRLYFGEGGVDDAEDADVVLHELGHGLHDWVTNRKLSQVQGLSEGSGDYWAQSYKRSLELWKPTDPQYNWVFNWDGHNQYWNGRSTNYTANYPPTGSSIHTSGQLWATVLMKIYDQIGKRKTDIIFLEGLARTTTSSNQKIAATAARQVAIDLKDAEEENFTCEDITIITEEFNKKNFALPVYEGCDLAVKTVDKEKVSIYPNPAKDFITINNIKTDDTVTIVNALGQKVIESKINASKNSINVEGLPKGVYIISLKNAKQSIKFIKN